MKNEFLSEEWRRATNAVLGRKKRPVTPATDNPTIEVNGVPSGLAICLGVEDQRPQILSIGKPGSSDCAGVVRIPDELIRAAFLDGDMDAIHDSLRSGEVKAEGDRVALLYFMYHLFPDGRVGAKSASSLIRGITRS